MTERDDLGRAARERMRRYRAHRTDEAGREGVLVIDQVDGHDQARPLRHWPLHSPTGFQWGYGGSGPADLALAILLDYMNEWPTEAQMDAGESRAWSLHQYFKWDYVARFSESWEISALDIQSWLQDERQRQALGEFEAVLQSIEDERRLDAELIAQAVREQHGEETPD